MEANGAAKNGKHSIKINNYPEFTLGDHLTSEQKDFFEKNGFIHFKNFIPREMVTQLLTETERIQDDWVAQGHKMINGVPIKYGTDISGKKIVQRFAFLSQHSELFSKLLQDNRLKALFDFIGTDDCRIGETEKDGLVFNHYINTEESDAAIGLSADGQQLFIFSPENGGDILYSNFDGGGWTIPLPVGSDINTKYWETHACISADGQTLYFVSDRPGGFGGRDIYKCVKLPNGSWSLATNLGATVNTAFDETSKV